MSDEFVLSIVVKSAIVIYDILYNVIQMEKFLIDGTMRHNYSSTYFPFFAKNVYMSNHNQ